MSKVSTLSVVRSSCVSITPASFERRRPRRPVIGLQSCSESFILPTSKSASDRPQISTAPRRTELRSRQRGHARTQGAIKGFISPKIPTHCTSKGRDSKCNNRLNIKSERRLLRSYIAVTARSELLKAEFHYAIWFEADLKLVADLQRAEIWPII